MKSALLNVSKVSDTHMHMNAWMHACARALVHVPARASMRAGRTIHICLDWISRPTHCEIDPFIA